jgi:hypothetical protein
VNLVVPFCQCIGHRSGHHDCHVLSTTLKSRNAVPPTSVFPAVTMGLLARNKD